MATLRGSCSGGALEAVSPWFRTALLISELNIALLGDERHKTLSQIRSSSIEERGISRFTKDHLLAFFLFCSLQIDNTLKPLCGEEK